MQPNFPKSKSKSLLDNVHGKMSREEFRNVFGVDPEQFEQAMKQSWDREIKIGIATGHLSRRADGAIGGKGDPADWFDAVDACDT